MTRRLVCFAVREELAPFRSRVIDGVRPILTGIGPNNARTTLLNVLKSDPPEEVFTCGFAGGLNPRLAVGTVVFDAENLPSLTPALINAGAVPCRFHCSSRIATTADEKRLLYAETGKDAVEMESGVIQEICRERGIPVVTVRAISDTAEEDLPVDFNALFDSRQRIRWGRFGWKLMCSPGLIPALKRLQRHSAMAAGRLADVLHLVLTGEGRSDACRENGR